MATAQVPYPVVDLFAGPGGLGEGFASLTSDQGGKRFESVVAIERDEFSHQTQLLRHFLRRFPSDALPNDYYRFLRGDLDRAELFRRHKSEFAAASKSALKISLGPEAHSAVKWLINQRDRRSGALGARRRTALPGVFARWSVANDGTTGVRTGRAPFSLSRIPENHHRPPTARVRHGERQRTSICEN